MTSLPASAEGLGWTGFAAPAVVVGYLTAFRILLVRLYEVTGGLQVYSFALAGVLWIAVGVVAARRGAA